MIEGLRRVELALHADERGWFAELARTSNLPKPIRQVNLARSRLGVTDALVAYLVTEEYDSAEAR